MSATWNVAVEEDGLGEVVWEGQAATYTAALGQAFPNVSPASFRDFVDVSRNGTRFECPEWGGSRVLVVEKTS